eukprot:scaffold85517_cov32-Tisochrysis_lutea.AAC.4
MGSPMRGKCTHMLLVAAVDLPNEHGPILLPRLGWAQDLPPRPHSPKERVAQATRLPGLLAGAQPLVRHAQPPAGCAPHRRAHCLLRFCGARRAELQKPHCRHRRCAQCQRWHGWCGEGPCGAGLARQPPRSAATQSEMVKLAGSMHLRTQGARMS